MGEIVHARVRGSEYRYRVWSTTVDAYLTPELTEREVVTWLLYRELGCTLQNFGTGVEARLERARAQGSSGFGDNEDPDGGWREQRAEWGEDDPHASWSKPVPDAVVMRDPLKSEPLKVGGIGFKVTLEVEEFDPNQSTLGE